MKAITDTDTQMVVCDCTYVDEQGVEIEEEKSPIVNSEVLTPKEYLKRLAEPQSGYYITVWNRLYKKEILANVTFPVGRTNEDSYVVHHIVNNCKNIFVLNKSFVFYTQRDSSLSRTPKADQYFDLIEAMIERIEFYGDMGYKELIPTSMDELIKLFIQVRRHFLFRGKKTLSGFKRASEIKKQAITVAKDNTDDVDEKDIRTLRYSDIVIAVQLMRERLGNRINQ